MRTVTILVIGILLIIALSIAPYIIIHNSSRNLANNLDSLEHAIYQSEWEQAKGQLATTHEVWNKTKKTWSSIIDHQEIDNIDIAISRLEQYVDTEGLSLAAGEVSSLKQLVEHIADKEKPTFSNVF